MVFKWAASSLANSTAAAAAVTLAFTGLARLLHGVTWSGALAGAVVSFVLYMSAGPGAFLGLVSVFLIAVGTTRVGYARKRQLGTAERAEGRNASQIFANLGVAAVSALLFKMSGNATFLLAAAAAMAEAAADTASSEIGEASSGQARLITSFKLVPAGTDGGITLTGSLAGAAAATVVAVVASVVGLLPARSILLVSTAGFCGMVLDSILGAVLERRGVLNNDTVNFLGTLSAALIVVIAARCLS